MLPEAVSEALGISLSEVLNLYFGDLDEVRRDCLILIWELIARRRDEEEERYRFEENSQREQEAKLASYIEGDDTF
jgi:hypothetical protein